MDRRLLIPAVAVTAWAQQTNPAAAKAEKALRARAQEFFQMQVDKKYRQAEALVAEDSRDDYYNGSKYNIKNFTIQKVELLNNTRAKVTIAAKVTLMMPQAGPLDFDAPTTSIWKVEKGHWVLYIDPAAKLQTPFGTLKPGPEGGAPAPLNMTGKAPAIAALQEAVTIDRKSLVLKPGAPPETVTVSNNLPGGVDLEVQSAPGVSGLSVELKKKHLEAGEKTAILFEAMGDGERQEVVHLLISPTAAQLDISVAIK